jgi:hypothetical protein
MRDKVKDAVQHVCEDLYYSRDDILRMMDNPAMQRGDNRCVMLAALAWHLRYERSPEVLAKLLEVMPEEQIEKLSRELGIETVP